MLDLIITTEGESKGRSFRASLLAYVEGSALWSGGATSDNTRPIWCMIAATDAESGPVMANLRSGYKASIIGAEKSYGRNKKTDKLEMLKSAGYEFAAQRHPQGTVWTAYLPELFKLDPGMVDPTGVKFAMLPAAGWCPQPSNDVLAHVQELHPSRTLADLGPIARLGPLFAAYLDRRSRCPMIPDPRFYAQIAVEFCRVGVATFAPDGSYDKKWHRGKLGYDETDVEAVGLLPGMAMQASHETVEAVLAEQVGLFDQMSRGESVQRDEEKEAA